MWVLLVYLDPKVVINLDSQSFLAREVDQYVYQLTCSSGTCGLGLVM